MQAPYRFAVCNEVFGRASLGAVCAETRALGYDGIELAPFTLAENPVALSAAERERLRETIEQNDLDFVGLHWILVGPPGLHATDPNEATRRWTWSYIEGLIDLCADLRAARSTATCVVVLGSPKQRSTIGGLRPFEAEALLAEELARIAPRAEDRGIEFLLEALSPQQTDVVTSLERAAAIVREIGSPAVQTMFDVHNAVDEMLPHPELITRYQSQIRHVHVNELDGQEPGMADYDFRSLFAALNAINYRGYVSVEAFDFSREGRDIAARALIHLKQAAEAPILSTAL